MLQVQEVGDVQKRFDRSSTLRVAQNQARKLLTYGCFRGTYWQALAAGLRLAWQGAKAEREEADWLAAQPPIPADVAERVRDLRDEAWGCRIDGPGNDRYSALMAHARDLEHAARGTL